MGGTGHRYHRSWIVRLAAGTIAALIGIGASWAATKAGKEPTEIRAKRMEMSHTQRKVIFTGAVTLKRGDFILHCDRLVAYYTEPARQLERAEAFGHVRMQQAGTTGRSREATLDYRKQLLTLRGDAFVQEQQGSLEGAQIVYNMKTRHTQVQAPASGRARLLLESDDSGNPVVPDLEWKAPAP